jgi:hypothetical protein
MLERETDDIVWCRKNVNAGTGQPRGGARA